ncbi:putative mitochondrial fusion protein [Stachybotrys elegans]|uniref:Mitochondrial fusion protein n=1 Tax=Stachybotrys elegans TaxID=80388 RepID=A0A8K0SRG4_9HYPO|nr:putative mitochondrial fusion protein [Stachybotrys elegans]
MSSHRDGVNPLRPYYKPPTIGEPSAPSPRPNPKPFSSGNATSAKYASKARDMFSDLDYNDYLDESSPSVFRSIKDLLDELMWKYTSVLMAQPFEVAKTILQVRDQDLNAIFSPETEPEGLKRRISSQGVTMYEFHESDSEGEEPAYFTSNDPHTPTPASKNRSGRRVPSPPQSPTLPKKASGNSEQYLTLRRPDSLLEVIGQLWQREGAWGVWKGSNATFLYTILQSLFENWSRSFLSAIFNVPDLGVKDDLERLVDIASPYPWASLLVAGVAAVATGVILAPLDLVRTRLIVTPSSSGQRRTLATLRALPSYFCPPRILLPTILHSLVHPVLTLSTPLVLRTRFMIDSQVSPMTFSFSKFLASSAAVMVKLPLETVLRRGQVAALSSSPYVQALTENEQKLQTVVLPGRYDGLLGTMYHIATAEGTREVPAKPTTTKKGKGKAKAQQPIILQGQGLPGLWRGWKVNWWGLVGLWTATAIGNGGEGEF